MVVEVRVFGADAANSQGLAVGDACLAVAGVAAGGMKVLVGVSWFGVESGVNGTFLLLNGDIEEIGLVFGNI